MEIVETDIGRDLTLEMHWLSKVIDCALNLYFKSEEDQGTIQDIPLPPLDTNSPYLSFLSANNFDFEERLILGLALAPLLKPSVLDVFKIRNKNLDCEYAEFGGIREGNKQAFIPTLETAIFLLSGEDLSERLSNIQKLNHEHALFRLGFLQRNPEVKQIIDQPLRISNDTLIKIFSGKEVYPEFSQAFPAQRMKSNLQWNDLVVDDSVRHALQELVDWISHADLIFEEWQLKRSLKRGFRSLFYGPPGTGKTLAATLIGQTCNRPVFRVDLSMIVSKYIGETEKNLAGLFDRAEDKEWILFFDEADALFGKRTQTKGSNDRYANQEVSYLLQRIEDFPGLVILATNLKDNMDEAFSRRFQSTIQFNKPSERERAKLWENYIFSEFELDAEINKKEIISNYEISGGELINILRFCSIRAAKRGERKLYRDDIMAGIKREYIKTNKTL